MSKNEVITNQKAEVTTPVQDLAFLGLNQIVYVREVSAGEADQMFEHLPQIPEDTRLYAAFNADGTPLFLSGSMPALLAQTRAHDLTVVPLH